VIAGAQDDGWIALKLLNPIIKGTKVVWNNAYYTLAELKKSEFKDED